MATSPIYGWLEPDNTDLVKNGALAIRTLGNAIDTTMATMTPKSIVDAKGDLIAATANDTPARIAVGSNFAFLQADSSTATGLLWDNAAFTTYTPSISAASGSFTTVSATGRYKRIGKVCFVEMVISITTNGTAGGNITASLPFSSTGNFQGIWREGFATGNCGIISAAGANAVLRTFTNGYPGADSYVIAGSVTYEVA
jgi:hypothetical protein